MPDDQILRHYRMETALATRLRTASTEARRNGLYKAVYDEYFASYREIWNRPATSTNVEKKVDAALRIIAPHLRPDTVFLEIGAGRCEISLRLASLVRTAHALEVAGELDPGPGVPPNFRFALTDGIKIPVRSGSVTVAYSNQVMEHLHPEDALTQLRNVHDALALGGVYICVTPNANSGPHDISAGFDPIATGLHLKEYTYSELSTLMKRAGFRRVRAFGLSRFFNAPLLLPSLPFRILETFARSLSTPARRKLCRSRLGPLSLNHVRLAAFK